MNSVNVFLSFFCLCSSSSYFSCFSWDYFPHDHARSRAYRWGEDGLMGITDRECRLCFGFALWNEKDPILKVAYWPTASHFLLLYAQSWTNGTMYNETNDCAVEEILCSHKKMLFFLKKRYVAVPKKNEERFHVWWCRVVSFYIITTLCVYAQQGYAFGCISFCVCNVAKNQHV